MPPPDIKSPSQLVEEFKKSGEFDKLRRELLQQFRASSQHDPLVKRAEEIAREKIKKDERYRGNKSVDAIHLELMQEIDRYPVVERAVADFDYLRSSDVSENISKSLDAILNDDGTAAKTRRLPKATLPTPAQTPARADTHSPARSLIEDILRPSPLPTPTSKPHTPNASLFKQPSPIGTPPPGVKPQLDAHLRPPERPSSVPEAAASSPSEGNHSPSPSTGHANSGPSAVSERRLSNSITDSPSKVTGPSSPVPASPRPTSTTSHPNPEPGDTDIVMVGEMEPPALTAEQEPETEDVSMEPVDLVPANLPKEPNPSTQSIENNEMFDGELSPLSSPPPQVPPALPAADGQEMNVLEKLSDNPPGVE